MVKGVQTSTSGRPKISRKAQVEPLFLCPLTVILGLLTVERQSVISALRPFVRIERLVQCHLEMLRLNQVLNTRREVQVPTPKASPEPAFVEALEHELVSYDNGED